MIDVRYGPPRVTERDLPEGPWMPRACRLGGGDGGGSWGGGGGGGLTQTDATSTTTAQPWSVQQPYLQTGFNSANALYNGGGPQYFPGSTVAPFTNAQNAALGGIIQQATAGSPLTPAATGFATNLLNGGYLTSNPGAALQMPFATGQMSDPSRNPYFQQALQSTLANVLPGIDSQFVAGGNLNNPAMAFAAGQGAMNAVSPYLFNSYQQGLQQQQQAAQNIGADYQQTLGNMMQGLLTAPQIQEMPYSDLVQLWGAGTAQQQQGQAQTNADIARWNYAQQLPYAMLQQYMGTIGGTGYGGTSQTTTPYFQNTFGNALGAGLGGGMMGGALGGGLGGLMGGGTSSSNLATLGTMAGLAAMFV